MRQLVFSSLILMSLGNAAVPVGWTTQEVTPRAEASPRAEPAISSRPPDYASLQVGQLKGKLIVQWLEPDLFLFIPDPVNPLVFTRGNGKRIQPGRMLTDGGSIPRPMWAFRSYSPWGYAPAFIVHDWLFHIKRCRIGNYADYTLESTADVMGEVIKTMMETGKVEKHPATVEMMHAAVSSSFARTYWDRGVCQTVPAAFDRTPVMEYTLDFG